MPARSQPLSIGTQTGPRIWSGPLSTPIHTASRRRSSVSPLGPNGIGAWALAYGARPTIKEVMDAVSLSHPVRRIVFMNEARVALEPLQRAGSCNPTPTQ